MNTNTDQFDENNDPINSLFDQPSAGNLCSLYLGSESLPGGNSSEQGTDHLNNASRPYQGLSRQVAEERRAFDRERQRLIEENARLVEENQQLKRDNERLANQAQSLMSLAPSGADVQSAADFEMASHQLARRLAKVLSCDLACVFRYESFDQSFRLQASAGPSAASIPGTYTPTLDVPWVQQTIASLQPACYCASEDENDNILHGRSYASLLAAPILHKQDLKGLVLLGHHTGDVLSELDTPVIATAASLLSNTWGYAQKTETLTEFVQAVSSLSIVQETGSLLEVIASLARRTLNASFTLVAILNQQDWMMRASGKAPQIFASLQNGAATFLDEASKSPYTFRLRDLRNDPRSARVPIDSPDLRTLLASPIRINGATSGVLLAFGKLGSEMFTDSDVFLTELLVTQAATNLESCHLNQELRANLKTTQLLYELSRDISQAEDLEKAAQAITRTAYHLLEAHCGGMILFSSDGRKEAEVRLPAGDESIAHPYSLIQQAIDSRQTIYMSESETITRIAIPIQTMRRCYGALWMELEEEQEEARHPTEEIRILVNQAAVALERSILLEETRLQTVELRRANQLLIESYDQLLEALMRALDARDSETEGHSARVKKMALDLGREFELSKKELKSLERGSLLHDIGKIGIRDAVLLKPGPLDSEEWKVMRRHPQIGARIIQEIPALQDALPVIAFHQERWDGSGYPLHLTGQDIPLLARIFAVVDVFDALTSERPYRSKLTMEEALQYLESQSGSTFDPEVVDKFAELARREYLNDPTNRWT